MSLSPSLSRSAALCFFLCILFHFAGNASHTIHSICLFRFNLLSQVIVNTIYCAWTVSRSVPFFFIIAFALARPHFHTHAFSGSSFVSRLLLLVQRIGATVVRSRSRTVHTYAVLFLILFFFFSLHLQMMRHSILNTLYTH